MVRSQFQIYPGEGRMRASRLRRFRHAPERTLPWQRTIPHLPNIQFILTTHSPQVLSTLKKENVFILEDFKLVKDTPHTFGRDSNAILWDIFGVEKRPPEAKEEFAKLYRIMDDPEKVGETADMLQDVEAKYGYYDEEVVRARGHFQFLNEA
ncbi:MAG: hypothetical protein IPM82_11155 [Saprospiraceae bacterium]|nr:hypothetical protein [Saprospiraceae bacterium]